MHGSNFASCQHSNFKKVAPVQPLSQAFRAVLRTRTVSEDPCKQAALVFLASLQRAPNLFLVTDRPGEKHNPLCFASHYSWGGFISMAARSSKSGQFSGRRTAFQAADGDRDTIAPDRTAVRRLLAIAAAAAACSGVCFIPSLMAFLVGLLRGPSFRSLIDCLGVGKVRPAEPPPPLPSLLLCEAFQIA